MDIISKGDYLAKFSLAQKIESAKVKLKKVSIRVPKLKIKKGFVAQKKDDNIQTSSIINILIKSSIEKAKRERKEKKEESKSYRVSEQERPLVVNGGYGTISKDYGSAPHKSYVDYEKLFSYLGKFRSKSPYEDIAEHISSLNKASESSSFVLADRDSMDKVGRYEKYIKSPVMAMQTIALSLVPIAGLSSAEWEEIKMLMKFDSVIYTLKTKNS